jgi:hypothetical protein
MPGEQHVVTFYVTIFRLLVITVYEGLPLRRAEGEV